MARQLHDGMMARITDNDAISKAFAATSGVKQGCLLSPTLFSLMFSVILTDANRYERYGIRIAYETDRHLFNNRLMKALTRPSTTPVHDIFFADDCVPNTTTVEDMQRDTDLFASGHQCEQASDRASIAVYL
ncbi:hypothetical protein SprV_0100442900 [Sparganum proliferum]